MKPKLTTRILKYLLITSTAIAVASALIWIALQGYSAPWTGFGDFTKPNSDFIRGKTLWDWIQLFIIPLVGSVGIFLLNRSEREIERQRAEDRAKLEREIALDRQRESALQTYLDRMADLLLKEKLLTVESDVVRDVARIRTLTILRGLDAKRKGVVLQFLCEAGLIEKEKPIVKLEDADLGGADLRKANLININLFKANLSGADLSQANLTNSYLFKTNLEGANLQWANLFSADLACADLRDADLNHSFITCANLYEAKVSMEQLKTAALLNETKMPDGTKHD